MVISLYLLTSSHITYQNLCMHIEMLYECVHVVVKREVNLPSEGREGTCILNL